MASFRAAGDQIVPFSNMRRRTAEHMVRSKATSPHAFIANEVDFESVERVRKAWGERFKAEEGFALTYLPFVARAAVEALRDFPLLNASVVDDSLLVHAEVNLGIAVDLSHEGLIVPVIHRAEEVTLRGVARRIRDLAERARGRQLNADDIAGGHVLHHERRPLRHVLHGPDHQPAASGDPGHRRHRAPAGGGDPARRVRVHRHPLDRHPRRQLGPPGRRRRLRLAVPGAGRGPAGQPRLGRGALGRAPVLRIRSLGTVPYHEAYALQHALATEAADDYLLVLQHPHTYTLGAHADERHVLVDPAPVGAVLERTDRGGDVTYHGPGQLVAYPIVTVPDDPASGPAHVHRLERDRHRHAGRPRPERGDHRGRVPGRVARRRTVRRPRKIAAIGVRTLRAGPGRRRTLHGVALNVTSDLAMFGHIVPVRHRRSGRDLAAGRGHRGALRSGGRRLRGPGRRRVRRPASMERADVRARARRTCPVGRRPAERPLLRRLRQAGVAPEEGSTSGSASRSGYGCRCASARATASSARRSTTSAS